MDIFLNLILGIVASIIAGILLLFGTVILSKSARWVFTGLLGRILDIDVEYVFKSSTEASSDIQNEIERAEYVFIMTGRGNELTRNTFDPLFKNNSKKQIKILLPSTNPIENGTDWLFQRAEELKEFDEYNYEILSEQVKVVYKFLEPKTKTGLVQVKDYNVPNIGRIILTDRCAYFTPYQKNLHGRDSRVTKYRGGGDMYKWLNRLFNQLWNVN